MEEGDCRPITFITTEATRYPTKTLSFTTAKSVGRFAMRYFAFQRRLAVYPPTPRQAFAVLLRTIIYLLFMGGYLELSKEDKEKTWEKGKMIWTKIEGLDTRENRRNGKRKMENEEFKRIRKMDNLKEVRRLLPSIV